MDLTLFAGRVPAMWWPPGVITMRRQRQHENVSDDFLALPVRDITEPALALA